MIDPNFWQSEDVSKLTIRQRLLLIGLFSNADDEGKLRGNPAFIRSIVFPYEDFTTEEMESDIKSIERIGSIILYEVDGSRYIKLMNWLKFQRVDKPQKSLIPEPRENDSDNSSKNDSKNDSKNESRNDSRLKEKKLKEEKRKNGETSSPKQGYTDDEKEPVRYLKQKLDEKGVTVYPKDWYLKGYVVSKGLLSGDKPLSKEQIIQIIDWGLSNDFWRNQIDSMSSIQRITPKWQLEQNSKKPLTITESEIEYDQRLMKLLEEADEYQLSRASNK